MMNHVSRFTRAEMTRAHAGLVTAFVAGDEDARSKQLASIVREHAVAAAGDTQAFAGLMAKQVEAGAAVTYTVLRSLAPRLGLTDAETQELIAQAVAQMDESAFPE
ncbi:hypothetical protein [Microbacterium sp. K27]|uniref:hypothetical protein n=1 Tax=Microbacterium sp. K27 TaxID=2305445 RepID=UPI00109BB79F|nr:hypothetical protein [Microbacterium sp. K27]